MLTAEQLRAYADQLEAVEKAQHDKRTAEAAYRGDPDDPAKKQAHRHASAALIEARRSMREVEPEDLATVRPQVVRGAGRAPKVGGGR